MSYAIETKQNS